MDLKEGDKLGVIGHNGAGKTTLLRTLSGVYEPTSGEMKTEGKVSTLTDITLGMNEEANGYENIITRGIFMGMTFVIFAIYGILAGGISKYLINSPKAIRRLQRSFAVILAGLAVKLALSEQ